MTFEDVCRRVGRRTVLSKFQAKKLIKENKVKEQKMESEIKKLNNILDMLENVSENDLLYDDLIQPIHDLVEDTISKMEELDNETEEDFFNLIH